MKKTVYIRTLKHVDYSVFCVQDGQKSYYDPQFGHLQPYSSGQQVKRSIISELCQTTGRTLAPIDFYWVKETDKNKKTTFKEGEVLASADPAYPDQLFGGYMKATKREEKTETKDEKNPSFVVKRRSPLSISAMRPLHPLLAGLSKENASFDRTDAPTSQVIVKEGGRILSAEEVTKILEAENRSLPKRKFLQDQKRATGLYVTDICIDLERLFSISLDPIEPEVYINIAEQLVTEGWQHGKNSYGTCLIAPKALREELIPALAHSLLNWRITSNQARTFSLMETLAVAISDNAQHIAGAIRARLREDSDKPAATPFLDQNALAELFIALPAEGYITGDFGATPDALEQAQAKLVEMLMAYDYEKSVQTLHI